MNRSRASSCADSISDAAGANPPPPSPSAKSPRILGFEFLGSGAEYFRVWIVNVMLSIITLGLYSAWAKVRNKQYFHGNTRLDGAAFEYTANPVNILKGRIIVAVVFLLYGLVATLVPGVEPLMMVLVIALVPWVVVRALAFNARYSSHRNVRFGFDGGYARALVVYVLLPVLGVLTLGLAYPLAVYAKRKFTVDRARYGATPFDFDGPLGRMYVIYLKAAAVLGAPVAMLAVVWAKATGYATTETNGEIAQNAPQPVPPEIAIWMAVAVLVLAIVFLLVSIYLQTAVSNYVWRHTRLGENRFDLRLELLPMLWIQCSNLAMIIATFGLMIPFARVRVARYRIERMTMLAAENPDEFAAGERDRVRAIGEEFGDAFDLDLAM